tara:strand:+ start:415 stop:882 length:468 start_codon:yes stop_codon:yes gene_type:complete
MIIFISMLLCLRDDEFDKKNILINNRIKNNVINNSYFHRIYYSDDSFILNGITIEFTLKNINIEKHFNKIKINFNKKDNANTIDNLLSIEEDLMNMFHYGKKRKLLLREQIGNNYIKINNKIFNQYSEIKLILKISGFWESVYDYGITFRCLNID